MNEEIGSKHYRKFKMKPKVEIFSDPGTNNATYLVRDPASNACAVIDSLQSFDLFSGRLSTTPAQKVIEFIQSKGLKLEWILETHIHADHFSAAGFLRERVGGKIAIGKKICQVQKTFKKFYNLGAEFVPDGSHFDHLFQDEDKFSIGNLSCQVFFTPGHTPACVSYLIGEAVFTGDTLFMPDSGTARCDFPGGDAGELFDSIQKIFALPEETQLFVAHDYKAPGREKFAWESTISEQKRHNVHVGGNRSREEFCEIRRTRDLSLSTPRMMLVAIQSNMRGGRMPPPEGDGISYLKIPVNKL